MGRNLRKAISVVCATVAASATLAGVATTPAVAATTGTESAVSTPINPYCDVSIDVISQWSTGYAVVLTIRNISTVPVRWSRLTLRFPGPVISAQMWNVTYTQTGPQATIVPSIGAGLLNPGQSVMIGMIGAAGPATPPQRELICAPAS